MDLRTALSQLDPANDDHWTADGQPRIEAVNTVLGHAVRRQEIIDAAPGFTRATAQAEADGVESTGDGTPAEEAELGAEGDEAQAEVDDSDPGDEAATGLDVLDGGDEDDGAALDGPDAPDGADGPDGPDGPDRASSPPARAPVAPGVPLGEAPGSVLRMPIAKVLGSRALTERAFREIESAVQAETAVKKESEKRLAALNQYAEVLSRHLDRMTKGDTHGQRTQSDIQAYLHTAAESRNKRFQAAQKFVGSGTSAKDVADVLRVGSKLDQVMSRRTGHGNRRPEPRAPAPG